MPEADYFTDDKEDAAGTAHHVMQRHGITESGKSKNKLFKGIKNVNTSFKGDRNKANSRKLNKGRFYGENKEMGEKCMNKKKIPVYGGNGEGKATIDKKKGKLKNTESSSHYRLLRMIREALVSEDSKMLEPKSGHYALKNPKATNAPFKNRSKFYGKNKQRGISESDCDPCIDGDRMNDFFGAEDEINGDAGGGELDGAKRMTDFFSGEDEVDGDGQGLATTDATSTMPPMKKDISTGTSESARRLADRFLEENAISI